MSVSAGRGRIPTVVVLLLATVAFGLSPSSASAGPAVVNVPADVATIQGAIDMVAGGGTVVVAAGVYDEKVVLSGKSVAVRSADGPGTTIIDGEPGKAVVSIHGVQTSASVFEGFTVRHGGPGISLVTTAATVVGNVVTGNTVSSHGGGISVGNSQATIRDNVIRGNRATFGGGMHLSGTTGTEIVGNTIEGNEAEIGGGVEMSNSGSPLLWNNLFRANRARVMGGALVTSNVSSPWLAQNVFVANEAGSGGAISLTVPDGVRGAHLVNNTFVANRGQLGSAIDGWGDFFAVNNVITGPPTGPVVQCQGTLSGRYFYNDIYNGTATPFRYCPDVRDIVGNISVDPLLGDDFSPSSGSPVIDVGHDDVLDPHLAPVDGNDGPRVVDGDGDLVATVDMGAFEWPGAGWTPEVAISPLAVDFGTVAIGSVTTMAVTVTGAGRWTAHPGLPALTTTVSLSTTATTCTGASLAATESCSVSVTFAPTSSVDLSATLVIPSDAGTLTVPITGRASDLRPARYLDRVVGELFGRSPTAAEISAWTPLTRDFTGRVNLTVALVGSREARRHRIGEEAQAWLGHGPDPNQAAALVDAMGRGAVAEIAPALFAGSDEFYASSGGTPEAFVDAVFRQLFGVTPDAGGRNALAGVLRTGYSRTALAIQLLLHPAARGRLVDAAYRRHLSHPPDAAVRAFWVDTIVAGTRSEYVTAYLAATEELWASAVA